MIIVQLSDLHVGAQFLQEKFDALAEEINELNPDIIVITGDLTNEGLDKEYKKCNELLTRLNAKKIITISGNHDYRNTGYLLFKKFFPFETVNAGDTWNRPPRQERGRGRIPSKPLA